MKECVKDLLKMFSAPWSFGLGAVRDNDVLLPPFDVHLVSKRGKLAFNLMKSTILSLNNRKSFPIDVVMCSRVMCSLSAKLKI